MKFRERMLVMLVAAVMLVAGSLSYFAFAAGVTAVNSSCPKCGTGIIYHNIHYAAGEPSGEITHIYNGYRCTYSYYTKYYADMCGSCDYMTNVTTVRCERGHICGMHND